MALSYLPILAIYLVAIVLFGGYIRIIEISEVFSCFMCQELNALNKSYDYIIVGCGSAGSVLAHRLSQDPKISVLVLEAGFYGNGWFDIPAVGPLFQQSAVDWKYKTTSQSNAAKGLLNNIVNWPMGRIIGGSSRMNNMVYIRGHPNDFNDWYKDVPGYNFNVDILSYFKRSENNKGIFRNNTKFHSTNGHFIIEDLNYISSFAKAFLRAVEMLGYPIRDLNGAYNTGFMQVQVNTNAGQRWSSAHTLVSQSRHNLIIHTNSLVHKVLLKDNYEAYAVQYSYLGQTQIINATKGIILCAGVVGTPKILMLSGIGPRQHLQSIGIKTEIDLPVGNNLQDHVTTGLDLVLLNTTTDINLYTMFSPKALFDYFYHGTGPWTAGGCDVVGLLNTCNVNYYKSKMKYKQDSYAVRGKNLSETTENVKPKVFSEECKDKFENPDLQLMVMPVGTSLDGGLHFRKVLNLNDITWNEYFAPLIEETAISILPVVLHPKSRGTVRLLDNNPQSLPVINPNYLSDPYDVDILLKGIDLIKQIIKTPPMLELGAKLNTQKFPGCRNFDFDTEAYWECYVRHLTLSTFHPCGTCKMGKVGDTETVVNHNFAIHSTNNLYVVDASVMPSLPSGNINAAVVMLAEKASDFLKWKHYQRKGSCKKLDFFLPKLTCTL